LMALDVAFCGNAKKSRNGAEYAVCQRHRAGEILKCRSARTGTVAPAAHWPCDLPQKVPRQPVNPCSAHDTVTATAYGRDARFLPLEYRCPGIITRTRCPMAPVEVPRPSTLPIA